MGTTGTARRWRALVPVLVVAALGACSEGDGDDVVSGAVDFEATGRYLAAASERSAGEPYRVEVTMAMDVAGDGEDLALEAPIMTGEQDGASFEHHMDLEEWLSQVPGGAAALGGGDLTMDMVGDADALYIRAPIYAALAERAGPAGIGPIGELAQLGDRWGRVDLRALGDLSLADLQGKAGAPSGADPRAILDVVAGAEDVEEVGTGEVDGTAVNGLRAPLSMQELLEAQGVDAERFVDQMSANIGGANQADPAVTDQVTQAVFAAEIPFEVWVDGDGYVRRVAYEMDLLDIFAGLEGFPSGQLDRFIQSQTMDFADYGAEDIAIEVPPDAVDVTDAYRRMLAAGQSGS